MDSIIGKLFVGLEEGEIEDDSNSYIECGIFV